MSGGRRVAVVGGGLAGITAALDLADAGADVTLLEVRTRLGGAAYSFERDGLEIDNGQHVFLRCCTDYRALIRRLGVEGNTHLQQRLSIPVLAPGGRRGSLARSGLPTPLHLAGALARYPFLSLGERLHAAGTARALSKLDLDDRTLDAQSFGSWLDERGESQAAVDSLWNLIALPTLNLPAERASLAMAAKVFQTGLLDAADAGDVGYSRVPLSRLHAEPAERALRAAGVDVRVKTRVQAVRPGVELESDAGVLAYDAAVVAVPHDRAAALLPSSAAYSERVSGLANLLGSNVGYDPMESTCPLRGSIATKAPAFAGLPDARACSMPSRSAFSLSFTSLSATSLARSANGWNVGAVSADWARSRNSFSVSLLSFFRCSASFACSGLRAARSRDSARVLATPCSSSLRSSLILSSRLLISSRKARISLSVATRNIKA